MLVCVCVCVFFLGHTPCLSCCPRVWKVGDASLPRALPLHPFLPGFPHPMKGQMDAHPKPTQTWMQGSEKEHVDFCPEALCRCWGLWAAWTLTVPPPAQPLLPCALSNGDLPTYQEVEDGHVDDVEELVAAVVGVDLPHGVTVKRIDLPPEGEEKSWDWESQDGVELSPLLPSSQAPLVLLSSALQQSRC